MRNPSVLTIIILVASVCCGSAPSEEAAESGLEQASRDTPGLVVQGTENLDFSSFKVTFIELGADRCIPCKAMQPVMRDIAREYQDVIQVVFFDVWKDPAPARRYKVQMIPTQVFVDPQGREVARHVGFYPKEDIIKMLREKGLI